MAHTLDDTTVQTLLGLHPWVRSRPKEEHAALALSALLDAEACRRGAPDPVSGALNVLFLTQGALLKPEYDVSVHGHVPWEVGLLTVDVLELIRVNQLTSFATGDRFLRAVASCLISTFASAHVVRIHTDCFCVLFAPSSGTELLPEHRALAQEALARMVADFRALEPRLPEPLDFTLGLARLRVVDPSHWQVLGPLVWAEAERVHVLSRAGKAEGILARSVHLGGRVAVEPSERSGPTRRRE